MSEGAKRVRTYKQAICQAMKDGSQIVCSLCGKPIRMRSDLTVDHILPKSQGGENAWNNLAPAHRSCNVRKGNRVV